MADLSITSTGVLPGIDGSATFSIAIAGEGLVAGDSIFLDMDDLDYFGQPKAKKSDCDDTSAAKAANKGVVATTTVTSGQAFTYYTGGRIIPGATLVKGTEYIVSSVAGKIAPASDFTTNWRRNKVGIAESSTVLLLDIVNNAITG